MSATPPSSSALFRRVEARLRVVGTAVGVVAFTAVVAYLGQSIHEGRLAIAQARSGPLLASMGLLLAAYAAQAYAWHLLVRAAGGDRSAPADCGRWALSLLGKYVPGKVFHTVGRLILYRDSPPGTAGLTAALAAELLLTLTAAACVAAVALGLTADALPPLARPLAAASAVAGVAVTFSTLFDRAAGWLAARALTSTPPAPIARRRRIAPFVLQIASYLLMGAGLYLLAQAWQQPSIASLPVVTGALCLSGIVGVIAIVVPAGIGVREGALMWLLAPVGGAAPAAFVAVAARLWLTAGDAVAAAIGAWVVRRGAGSRD